MRLQAHLEQPPQTINKVMGLNLLLRAVSLSVASLLLSCLVLAQGTVGGHPSNPPPPPVRPQTATFDQHRIQLQSNGPQANSSAGDRDACLLPPLTAIPLSTVGVADLKISSKAKKEYAAGCAALKDGKYDKAEESPHKAVGAEPKYVAAWVTLGQLLAGQQKLDDAHQACTQAQTADPKYGVIFVPR